MMTPRGFLSDDGFPMYFSRLPGINQRGVAHYDEIPTLAALDVDAVDKAVAEGPVVVDIRPITDYAGAHIPSSLSIELRGVFASWLGWTVKPDTNLVFVINPDQDADDLVRQCLNIGFERFAGYLDGGIDAWTRSGCLTSSIEIVDAATRRGTTLDIRQDDE